MPVTTTPIYPQTITSPMQQILPATTTTLVSLYTAWANGSKIERILISSTDTSARDVAIYITVSAVDYLIGTFSILANSGNTNAIPNISLFDHAQFTNFAVDANGNKFLYLATGAVLKAKVTVAVTAAKVIAFYTQGADY